MQQACQPGQAGTGAVGSSVGGVGSGVGGAAGAVIGVGADSVLSALSQWVAAGAAWLLSQVGGAMSASTRPDLGGTWFSRHFKVMAGLAAFLVLPLLLVSLIQAIARQDLSLLARSALVRLPLALLFVAVAVQLVQLALSAVDAMTTTVSSGAGIDSQNFMQGVSRALAGPALASGSPGTPAFVAFLGALVVSGAALALWLELVIRAAAIYVAVLFLPLALAGLVWPVTASWCRRLGEILGALILSKLVVVAVMSLAAGALSGEGGSSGFAGVIGGAALLLLAAFVPFTLLRLIPAVEAGAITHLEGVSRRARDALPAPSSVLQVALASSGSPAGLGDDIPMAVGKPEPPSLALPTASHDEWRDPGSETPHRPGPGPVSPGPGRIETDTESRATSRQVPGDGHGSDRGRG